MSENGETTAPDPEAAVVELAHRLVTGAEERLRDEIAHRLSAEERARALEHDLSDERSERSSLERKLRSSERARKVQLDRYSRLRRRRAVRLALGVADRAGPAVRKLRSLSGRVGSRDHPELSPDEPSPDVETQREVRREHLNALAISEPEAGDSLPTVSVIIVTRNGAEHLRVLMPALVAVDYPSLELVVVDNGSSDATLPYLTNNDWPFPVQIVENATNESFSVANNQGAERASGDLLLFLNNDVSPIGTNWLTAMVAATRSQDVVAVGASLIYPETDRERAFAVQHAGVSLSLREGHPHAINVQPDIRDLVSWPDQFDVDATTAAVLLVKTDCYRQIGGFSSDYVYGAEDVDLCLRLREIGRIVVAKSALLFHQEFGTQQVLTSEIKAVNRRRNWQQFGDVWGPRVSRDIRRRRLVQEDWARTLAGEPPRVAITLTHNDPTKGYGDYYTAHELGDAFEGAGWHVVYAERYKDRWYDLESVDLLISLLDAYDVRRAPPGAVCVAWVRNWVERWLAQPWFAYFDAVGAGSSAAAAHIRRWSEHLPTVIPLATNPRRFHPGPSVPTYESDYVFAGNYWNVDRDVSQFLRPRLGETFLLFGKGWETGVLRRHWHGHLDYGQLPDVYRSATIVLDDTAGPTLPYGFVNSRVFDALASGTLVVSNNGAGSEELFGGMLPTYNSAQSLRDLLDRYLADDDLRESTAAALRQIVLANHTYDRLPHLFVHTARHSLDSPRVAITMGAPTLERAQRWGDWFFARGLARSLADVGFLTTVHPISEWESPTVQRADVVIHLRGLTPLVPRPSQFNVLWVMSHPDDLVFSECDSFDVVLVASRHFANVLAARTTTPVFYVPQATDGRYFSARASGVAGEHSANLVFVGNSRGVRRHGVAWAIERRLPLTIIGRGWESIDNQLVSDSFVPNDQLASVYSSAGVVLNDHWADMAKLGFVSNRLFDVLACGGVVVSDDVDGIEELFGDLVPTYRDADELELVVTRLLNDEAERARIATEGPRLVAEAHTWAHRAAAIAPVLRRGLEGRARGIGPDAFAFAGPTENSSKFRNVELEIARAAASGQ